MKGKQNIGVWKAWAIYGGGVMMGAYPLEAAANAQKANFAKMGISDTVVVPVEVRPLPKKKPAARVKGKR